MLTKEQYDVLKAKTELTDVEKASLLEYEKSTAESKNTEHMIPKSRLDEEITKRKELEARLTAIETANKTAEEQRMIEAQQYKELYEKAKAEAEGLKPKAAVADDLEKVVQASLESQLKEIPEHLRGLVPEGLTTSAKLQYIAQNRALLMKEKPFTAFLEIKKFDITAKVVEMQSDSVVIEWTYVGETTFSEVETHHPLLWEVALQKMTDVVTD